MLARAIRWGSVALCLLVATSFSLFAVDQIRSASQSSQDEIAGKAAPSSTASHHSGVRKAIDDAASAVESPFTGAGLHVSNEWGDHGALLVLSLLLYGAGLGFFARWIDNGVTGRRGRRRGRGDPSPPGSAFAA